VGNRATQTKDGNQTSYTYNNMNQMSAAGSASFTYDSNGNTATKTESQATTNYTWDYENRLTKIDNPSGDDYVYEYDGNGMRVRAGHDSGQGNVWDTRFYYDVGAPLYAYLFESDNDKTMTVAYTVGPSGNLISQRRSGSTYYHLYDRLGSTRKLLDSSQATTDSYSYYAFGEVRTSSGSTTNPFKFVGRLGYYDDPSTDFQYLRARYYAPGYGRFVSMDTVTRSRGGYVYTRSHPVAAGDPSGHDQCNLLYKDDERYLKDVKGLCTALGLPCEMDWPCGVGSSTSGTIKWPGTLVVCDWYHVYEVWDVYECTDCHNNRYLELRNYRQKWYLFQETECVVDPCYPPPPKTFPCPGGPPPPGWI